MRQEEIHSVSIFHCYSNERCERMRVEMDALSWCSEKWKCYQMRFAAPTSPLALEYP